MVSANGEINSIEIRCPFDSKGLGYDLEIELTLEYLEYRLRRLVKHLYIHHNIDFENDWCITIHG